MEQNKDQSGAAVRGEAVAGLPARRFVHVSGFLDADYIDFKAGEIFGGGVLNGVEYESKHYTRTVAEQFVAEGDWREVEVSARAADAPSEPTDLSHRLRETADKQPGWKPLLDAAAEEIERYYGGMLAWKKTAEKKDADWNAIVRAADALDSQPTVLAYVATDLDGRADVGMTPKKAMERAGHGCDTIIPVYDLGSSQPTDGGVRNG